MANDQEQFDYAGIHCFRYMDAPQRFYYVPGDPTPMRDAQGQPAISLLKFGDKAILQLTSQWAVENSVLEALITHLAGQCSGLEPETIQLAIAPLTIREVSLILTPEGKNPQTLGTSHSSGYPPYMAAFSINCAADQIEPVTEALSGNLNQLFILYKIALQKRVLSEASFNLNSPFSSATSEGIHQVIRTAVIELEREADVGQWR